MDSIKLSNFIVIMSFSNNERSLLDCIMPFVEYGISKINQEYINVSELKDYIKKECLIDIPTATIRTLLKRLKRDNRLTDYENWTIIRCVDNFSVSSKQYESKLQSFSRDVNRLLNNCKAYCQFEYSNDDIAQLLYEFIGIYQHNIDINEGTICDVSVSSDVRYEKLSQFISYISQFDNTDYNTFKSMFYGFILGQFVASGENYDQKKVRNCTVYVDTDFLLRILDMQAPYFTETATELLSLLVNFGFTILALPETVSEARTVLQINYMKFIRENENLKQLYGSKTSQLDGILGAFFRRGMSNIQIANYIDNIETEIEKLSICVCSTGVPANIEIRQKELDKIIENKVKNNRLDRIKDFDNKEYLEQRIRERSTLDAKLLALIRRKRGKRIYKFQDAKYILLSCDNVIYRVNKNSHKFDGSIPECFNESSLTSLLFMCSPSQIGNMPIKLLISLFQSSKYVDYDVLTQFHSEVANYVDSNPEEQQYLTEVFRNQNLFAMLSGNYELESASYTCETDLIKTLFETAKENSQANDKEKETVIEENKKLKSELEALKQAQLPSVALDVAQELPLEDKTSPDYFENFNSSSIGNNPKAELILRNSIMFFLFIVLSISLMWSLKNANISSFAWTLAWWSHLSFFSTPTVFLLSFIMHIHSDETMKKIINRIIYEQKGISLVEILLIAALHSGGWTLTSFILPVIGLISDLCV